MFPGRVVRFRLLGMVVLLAGGCAFAQGTVTLVKEGRPTAVIVTDASPPGLVKEAAALLQRVIEESSGAKLDVTAAAPAGSGKAVLHLGVAPADRKLDKDGFIITCPSPQRVELLGGSEYGALFGAQDFLERYLGVRWLFPGPLGEYIPKRATLSVPRREVRDEPVFFSRQLSGTSFSRKSISTFLLRQRMHGRVRFHHNLLHLFPASKYVKTHPEFFPVLDGKRYLPRADNDHHWQPNLRAKGIVREAVDNICAFFDQHPEAESYSLGMNDSHAWDDSVTKAPDARRNSLGCVDLSDYFFAWANKVATGVLWKHPDKRFGCLAYNELVDPPRTVRVHPRILPYVCFDRMYWADPALRRLDKNRTRAWMTAANRLAWYDYIYGDQFYLAPRFYPHLMAEYVRFAHANGVVAYYAEAYPLPKWSEGPKLYVFLRLLWNPDLDVDATLAEWYRLAVGEKAAPFLAKYYEFWEEFWTRRVPQTSWFKTSAAATCYLHFNKTGYFEALQVGDDERLDRLIDNMAAHAETPQQKARAAFLRDGWLSARAEIRKYLEIKKLVEQGPPPGTRLETVFASDFESEESKGRPAAGARPDWQSAGMPKGWGHWQRTSSHATFGWDRNTGRQSRASLAVDAAGSDGQPLCFLRTNTVEPDTLYRASCDVRTLGVEGEHTAIGVTIKWQDKNGKWTTQFATVDRHLKAPTSGRWEHLAAYVRTPKTEKPRLVFMLLVQGVKKGRVWFDNVTLERLVAK